MSSYVRNIVFKTEFDGDSVTLTMTPLALEEVVQVSDISRKSGGTEEKSSEGFAVMAPIVGKHLTTVEGLVAADNTPITKEELMASAYFTKLIVAAGMELLSHAYPKNPATPAP